MTKEQKEAIEYLKTRLHGNEGCKYIDVSQEDLRVFINLVDRKEKDIEGWKKYCEEIEEEQIEMSNKNCELEFEIEKLQKENEEKTTILLAGAEKVKQLEKENKDLKADNYELNNRITDLLENIPVQKVKDKIEEIDERIKNPEKISYWASYTISECIGIRRILQELLEERK